MGCTLLEVSRSALDYASRLAAKDDEVIGMVKRLARQYPRYGYRRIQVFMARAGYPMGCVAAVVEGRAAGAAHASPATGGQQPAWA